MSSIHLVGEKVGGVVIVTAPFYPYPTVSGVKYMPTVAADTAVGGCRGCVWLGACTRAVFEGDGLAFCEEVLENELLPADWLAAHMEAGDGRA